MITNKLNPDLHIICGRCGCKTMLNYRLEEELNDDTDLMENKVIISCDNCGTITYLDEIIERK